jgi:CRP-like cAMP-binding protein
LFDSGETLEYVYFPTTAVVSLLYVLPNGSTTEVAVIGQEGMVGMWWGTGERALCRAVVQVGGYAYRFKAQCLRDAVNQGGVMPQLLMHYANTLFAQVTHNAIGGRRSSVMQTLARWLLDRSDRSMSCELKVTHEVVASMLGVRRESITEAMGKLQESGAICCRRGKVAILDRLVLERCAGQRHCPEPVSSAYERMTAQAT